MLSGDIASCEWGVVPSSCVSGTNKVPTIDCSSVEVLSCEPTLLLSASSMLSSSDANRSASGSSSPYTFSPSEAKMSASLVGSSLFSGISIPSQLHGLTLSSSVILLFISMSLKSPKGPVCFSISSKALSMSQFVSS